MKTISIKIPEELENKVNAVIYERGINKSMLIREALVEYLADSEKRTKGSFAKTAKDLSGSLEGPEDLSTNPKHFEGFGS